MIIVPLKTKNFSELNICLGRLNPGVDLVEIWLDGIHQEFLSASAIVSETQEILLNLQQKWELKCLAVCKTQHEKGNFLGTPEQRISILQRFLRWGGDFVDLDISQNAEKEIKKIPASKLWLSFHDFYGTNSKIEILNEKHKAMQAFSPFLYKFAITPKSESALVDFINFAKNFPEKKAIFTAMGALGSAGREQLAPYTWGRFLALDATHKTASGQKTLQELLFDPKKSEI